MIFIFILINSSFLNTLTSHLFTHENKNSQNNLILDFFLAAFCLNLVFGKVTMTQWQRKKNKITQKKEKKKKIQNVTNLLHHRLQQQKNNYVIFFLIKKLGKKYFTQTVQSPSKKSWRSFGFSGLFGSFWLLWEKNRHIDKCVKEFLRII